MAWDLRAALLRKGETESARLDAFAFRLRARTMALLGALLAARLGIAARGDDDDLARAVAHRSDADILEALLGELPGLAREDLIAAHAEAHEAARTALIAELGDPAPHRLA